MRKILSVLVSVIMLFSVFTFASCKSKNKGEDYGIDLSGVEYNSASGEMYVGEKTGKTRIKISAHLGGYGIKWLLAIGRQFLLQEENSGYYLVLEGDSSLTASMSSKLESGRNLSDIYFALSTSWQQWASQGYLASLDDLFATQINGEEQTVGEKMNETWVTYSKTLNNSEKHSYAFPWTENITGIVYNETMFNQYGWTVPTTVQELITLCEKIIADTNGKVAPFVYPGTLGGYFDYLGTNWWLQSAGIDGMQQYMNFDSAEVYNPDKPLATAKLNALETFTSIFGPSVNTKYTLKGSNSKNHTSSQISFANGEAAMIPNGNWMENESADVIKENGISIKMMRTPYCDTALKNADNTYKQVCYGATTDFAVVPAECSNIEGAKKFLLFMSSDEMLELFTNLSGAVRPFNYDIDKCETSDFVKSCLEIWSTSERWFDCSESILYTAGCAKKFLTDNPYMSIVYDEYDAETFCYKDYTAAKKNWQSYLDRVGLSA